MLSRFPWLSRIRHRMRRAAIRLGLRLVDWAQSGQTAATTPEDADEAQAIARAKWFEMVRKRAPHLTRMERQAAPRLPKVGRTQPDRLSNPPDRDADSIDEQRKPPQQAATATTAARPQVAAPSPRSKAQPAGLIKTAQQAPPASTGSTERQQRNPTGPALPEQATLSPATAAPTATELYPSKSAAETGTTVRQVERDAATQESKAPNLKHTKLKQTNRKSDAPDSTDTGPLRRKNDWPQPAEASPHYSPAREVVLNDKLRTPKSRTTNSVVRDPLQATQDSNANSTTRHLSMQFESYRSPQSAPCPQPPMNNRRAAKHNATDVQTATLASDPWPSLLSARAVDSGTRLHHLEAGREQRLTDEQRGR